VLYIKLFKSLLIFLFLISSSCQSLNYSNIQRTYHHSYGDGELIIASLDDYNIYQSQDEISGIVIDKDESKKSKKKWLWVVLTIILVAVTITTIAIIDDDNGEGSNKPGGSGMDTDDVIDTDVVF